MSVPQIEELTIAAAHEGFRSGAFTARDLVDAYLDRIAAVDAAGPALNSIITIASDARDQADRLDAEFARTGDLTGPLHGVPVVVKDQIETADMPTSFGNVAAAEYLPAQDATAIAKLRDAGAIILGKTTLPDFATSWFSTSSRSGVTKNPYDLARDPGGSSSGSATAVAANLALVGIGEDTGGSIRLPASFCGLVGVRVTPGLISRAGMSSLVVPQDTAGPMTRTVEDAARLLDVLVGYDARDEFTGAVVVDGGGATYAESAAPRSVEGLRLGVLRQAFPDETDPDGAQAASVLETALATLADAGADLVEIEIDRLDEQVGFTSLYTTRSQQDMDAFVGARPDLPVQSMRAIVEAGEYHEKLDLLEAIVAGPLDPTDDPAYLERVLAQTAFQRQVLGIMAAHDLDAIVFPDSKLPAPTHADIFADRWTCLTYPTNTVIASQLLFPAITVPAGFTAHGLPVGLEMMSAPYSERALLGVAAAIEGAIGARRAPRLDTVEA
ncbi:amidase [Microbacterium sp. SLBN-146]|uniref:amidase n=1 Tax=Microbacterium sp. SLBN-146 TaxID=2768457 RepID=UPI0011544841|nr:amidase [Microbacterium sp. SLBN-146]TQJ31492.1 Asp-tRNA(Asn)/Glu-tRNA(Gln) amidotransferase A subunit family amidase [Microbacterium sp. SLBN-146]